MPIGNYYYTPFVVSLPDAKNALQTHAEPALPFQTDESDTISPGKSAPAQGNNISRTVTVNLNTPMVGNFTVNTKDTATAIRDIQPQIEEVLLRILDNAAAR